MKFKRRSSRELDINLTPLIDVVFLLLIFFMVSTTFTRPSRLVVDLPEAEGQAMAEQPEQLEIGISVDGDYAVNGRALVASNPATLSAAIKQLSAGDNTLPIVVTADANARHQAVVTAMDVARQLGFVHLSIITQQYAPVAGG